MKFSESWLREWVSPSLTTEELEVQVTMAGLEVDGVEAVAGEFSGIVVGQVVSKEQHPDADKLSLCQVSDGNETFQVVCGASNVREGLKIPFAKIGAVLPTPDGKGFKIKKAKLRGLESFGMLCAESEMGMADSSDGLMELAENAPVGTDVRDYLKLDDSIIEVDLTPNRADCLSIKGLAREVGTLNKEDVSEVTINPVAPSIDDKLVVNLKAIDGCPKYVGRIVKGVNLKAQTPLWMVEKLRRSGVRSIDPIVDVTNFVLLEQGQPMHAFDLAKLDGAIDVRMAKTDEALTLLDGQEVKLKDDTLVISDQSKVLAIAGIMGGEFSGVTVDTQDIFLEVAYFNPVSIAGKARNYGLHTDSSHRFERGVDYRLQTAAMERATQLILDICGGEAGPVVETIEESTMPSEVTVSLRSERVKQVLALELAKADISDMLTRLGMQVTETESGWTVNVPSYRFDISIEADLIEEIARIYGYNNLPVNTPVGALELEVVEEVNTPIQTIKQFWVDRGYQEAITYSFVDPKTQKLVDPERDGLALANPISADMGVMRTNLWVGLIKAAEHNLNRQQDTVRLFETGLRFIPTEGELDQHQVISGLICGSRLSKGWSNASEKVDFYDLKGDVEEMLALGGQSTYRFEVGSHSALHPGQCAAIYKGDKKIGLMGALHPVLQKQLGIKAQLYVYELLLGDVIEGVLPEYKAVSKFPEVSRDLAFSDIYFTVLPSENTEIVEEVLNEASGFLRSQLAKVLSTRTTPKLRFHYDNTIESGARMNKAINMALSQDESQRDLNQTDG